MDLFEKDAAESRCSLEMLLSAPRMRASGDHQFSRTQDSGLLAVRVVDADTRHLRVEMTTETANNFQKRLFQFKRLKECVCKGWDQAQGEYNLLLFSSTVTTKELIKYSKSKVETSTFLCQAVNLLCLHLCE